MGKAGKGKSASDVSKAPTPAGEQITPGRIIMPHDAADASAQATAVELARSRLHLEDAKFDAMMEIVMAVEQLTDTILALAVTLTNMDKGTRKAVTNYAEKMAESRARARAMAPAGEDDEDGDAQ